MLSMPMLRGHDVSAPMGQSSSTAVLVWLSLLTCRVCPHKPYPLHTSSWSFTACLQWLPPHPAFTPHKKLSHNANRLIWRKLRYSLGSSTGLETLGFKNGAFPSFPNHTWLSVGALQSLHLFLPGKAKPHPAVTPSMPHPTSC